MRAIGASWIARAIVGLSSLVGACGAERDTPPASSAGAGGASLGGSAGAGSSGAAGGGGTPAAGSSGTTGGAGTAPVGGAGLGGAGVGGAGSGGAGAGGAGVGGAGVGGAGSSGAGSGGAGSGGAGSGGAGSGGTAGHEAFSITSPAFRNVAGCSVEDPSPCEIFPDENVSYMDRANISPELQWTGVPAGTQSFAIVLRDVTYGQAHWVIWNIASDVSMLAADVPQDTATPASPVGSRQANANFATHGGDGYFGPHVPCNVFEFEIYALALAPFSPMDPESAVLVAIELQELGDPVLGSAKLTGRSNDYMTACE